MNRSLWIATKEQKEQLNSNQVTKKLSSEPVWLIGHFLVYVIIWFKTIQRFDINN